jgi:catechol 2,3-dioxygenase-like lactoylglutathione lyase family enzyme
MVVRPPFELKGLDHVVLRSANVRRLVRFYCNVLGCTIERRALKLGLIQLRAGNSLVDIVDVAGPIGRKGGGSPGRGGRNMDHLCLGIEPFDAETIQDYLVERGVTPGNVEARYGAEGRGPSIYLSDPDGNTVELKGPVPRRGKVRRAGAPHH